MSGIIADNSGRHTGLVKAASAGGVWNLILTQTASASATIDFTSGLDSTYDEYVFKFINIHPATDGTFLLFNMSIDSGSNYNVTKTSSSFYTYHAEDNAGAALTYWGDADLSQGTGFQYLSSGIDNDSDANGSGYLHLFNPSSTTFVKHFMSRVVTLGATKYAYEAHIAGYGNTTSAVDAIQFKMSSGNIDAGTISLYGIT